MSTNEIVNRAKVLDEAYEIEAVISLLKDYVRENPNDRDAMAFYLKNQAAKITLEYDEASQLYSTDTNRYSVLSTEKALMISEWCLAYIISCAYLKNEPEKDQEVEVCGALKTELLSLGSHLDDYNVAKTLLDKYYNMLRCCGYGKYFFKHLIAILDWQSVLTVNILKYIGDQYTKIPSAKSKEEIYNMYIEQTTNTIFPYSEMPSLSGDSLVVINIKTEEQLNFWRGYFTLEKKIREEEYAAIKGLLSDENSAFNCASSIDSYITNSWYNKVNRGDITAEDVAMIQVKADGYRIGKISESSYKSNVENAEKRLNTIRLNPINELTSKFTGFFNKFKK